MRITCGLDVAFDMYLEDYGAARNLYVMRVKGYLGWIHKLSRASPGYMVPVPRNWRGSARMDAESPT